MEWVETTGRSVQDAKEKALDELGVDEVDAEFEVVAEAQTGLFGRLRSEARVRARVRPTAPRAKEERRDRRRRSGGGGTGGSTGTGGSSEPAGRTAPAAEDDEFDKADRAASRDGRDRDDRVAGDPSIPATQPNGTRGNGSSTRSGSGAADEVTGRPQGTSARPASGEETDDFQADGPAAGRRNPSRRRGRGPNRPVTGSPSGAQRASAESDQDDFDTAKGPEVEVDLDRQAEVAVEFLTKLVAEFGLEATVDVVRPDEDTVELQLSGSDLGILIGPKGATLLAVQNLVRTVVFNETGGSNGHINVDVGGYRQKRSEALARFATQVATTVKESGARTVLEPMSAVDRKVVHDTISAIDGVSTISEGEEPRRRVVVLPG